jgi:transposase
VLFKGALTGPSPVDRARKGSKHHVICDASGIPLAISLTGGNRHDVTQLLPLVDEIDQRAGRLLADRGYDYPRYRAELAARGIDAQIARKLTDHGSGLGRHRWVVERTFAWLHGLRRLRLRWERNAELHQAFMHLGCAKRHAKPPSGAT